MMGEDDVERGQVTECARSARCCEMMRLRTFRAGDDLMYTTFWMSGGNVCGQAAVHASCDRANMADGDILGTSATPSTIAQDVFASMSKHRLSCALVRALSLRCMQSGPVVCEHLPAVCRSLGHR